MGSCLSKKSTSSSCAATAVEKSPEQTKSNIQMVVEKKKVEEETVKKEIFIIKHRKSNEIDRKVVGEEKSEVKKGAEVAEMAKNGSNNNAMDAGGVLGLGPGSGVLVAAPVRTSSCTKEEVDAILIQCGRLSRSSSTGKAALSASAGSGENGTSVQRGRTYSGSKRSYDFDHENGSEGDRRRGNGGEIDGREDNAVDDDNGLVVGERSNRHRQRQRQSRSVGSPSSKGRRRTPSRERDQAQQQQQRSGSRERVSGGSGRRVSRSPGRRSESPISTSSGVTAANSSSSANANSSNNVGGGGGGGGSGRPGKMVSVPATVSSLAMDKSNNAGGTETISASAVKRIQVKRNVGCDAAVGSRTVASPRARSPARISARASSENQNTNAAQNLQQPVSLSRSNSRKAEQSPYRRNPLGEIDTNVIVAVEQMPVPALKVPNNASQAPVHKLNADNTVTDNRVNKAIVDKNLVNVGCKAKEQQHSVTEAVKNPQANNAVNVVGSGSEILKPSHGGVTRSRSSRLSRDLDINPEALSNAAPSYTALLLEDIQNFHHKNNNTPTTPAFTLPACVSKACSILEAVADLNSSTGSNFSASAAAAFSDDKRRIPSADQFSKLCDNASFGAPLAGKKGVETKDPFMQSEVVVGDDDLMEPSFHKYVTVRRGGTLGGEDMEEQESSGSNSFVSGQQHWASSSWEPNSADSTDCWTSSSRSNCREDSRSQVVPFQRFALSSEPGYYDADEARRRLSGKKRDSDQQQNGIGRGRLGSRGIQSLPAAAAN